MYSVIFSPPFELSVLVQALYGLEIDFLKGKKNHTLDYIFSVKKYLHVCYFLPPPAPHHPHQSTIVLDLLGVFPFDNRAG